jgi:hypothetical protein
VICPNCHAEFRPGFTVCSDCDVALVDDLDATVAAVAGEELSDELEPFHETSSSDELASILEAFEEQQVPYVVQAGTALSLLSASAAGVHLPEEWRARILVHGQALPTAREILAALHEAAREATRSSGRGLLS